ncbi:MAG: nucleotidyl transferase AbiEii/AbiGii toxin family protein [Bacteroidetes bacterium]|nr:nucleotidyl transferase AbiEii/AbiGii toxin family protein [Bacteroidota bacterium]
MKLHENKELFQDAVLATAQFLNIPEIYIEKDYWVTVALHKIFHSEMAGEVVFKGGTALSKCHKLIERFSEDIDVVVLKYEGENDNQLKKKIKKAGEIVSAIMPEIPSHELTIKTGNRRKTVHQYNKSFKGNFGQVRENIVFEATWLGDSEPNTCEIINSYVYDMMQNRGQIKLIEKYKMHPFKLQVLSIEKTLCEKIMSLVRFSNEDNPYVHLTDKIRHIYDIHMMLKNVDINNFFASIEFNQMLVDVGKDDVVSFKNNKKWLRNHPAQAIVFKQPKETWNKIRTPYQTTFKDLVTGTLPEEKELIETLKTVGSRLLEIEWTIEV